MKALDIIKGLNKAFEEKGNKGYFVSKLNVEQNSISKLYKTYTLEVWYLHEKNKQLAVKVQKIARVPDNMEDIVLRDLNIELCYGLFRDYNKLMEYGI